MSEKNQLEDLKRQLRDQLPYLSDKYCVSSLGIFGSYLYGLQKGDSDVDVLVDFSEPISLLKYVELENYLSDVIGVKVDLVMKDSLKPRIGKYILRETLSI